MIQERLFALQDEKYREFQRSLIPGLPRENIIGIRIPAMRKLAKEFVKEPEAAVFLKQLPHTYYDENILHALLIAEIKDYDACMEAYEKEIPLKDVLMKTKVVTDDFTEEEIDTMLNPEQYLGLAPIFCDRVLEAYKEYMG